MVVLVKMLRNPHTTELKRPGVGVASGLGDEIGKVVNTFMHRLKDKRTFQARAESGRLAQNILPVVQWRSLH